MRSVEEIVNDLVDITDKLIEIKDFRMQNDNYEKDTLENKTSYVYDYIYEDYGQTFLDASCLLTIKYHEETDNDEFYNEAIKNAEYLLSDLKRDYELYKNKKEEVDKLGYEVVEKEIKDKLYNIFVDMLKLKNKSIDMSKTFGEQMEKASMHYAYFNYVFRDAEYSQEYNVIKDHFNEENRYVDSIEKLIILDRLYNELIDEEEGYKNKVNENIPLPIEEITELKDLVTKTQVELTKIYNEMLEYCGSEERLEDLYNVWSVIGKNYPWEEDLAEHVHFVCYADYSRTYMDTYEFLIGVIESLKDYKKYIVKYISLEEFEALVAKRKEWMKEKNGKDPYMEKMREIRKNDKYLNDFDWEDSSSFEDLGEEDLDWLDDEEF